MVAGGKRGERKGELFQERERRKRWGRRKIMGFYRGEVDERKVSCIYSENIL